MSRDEAPSIEWSLSRIADALERIADRSENPPTMVNFGATPMTEAEAKVFKRRFASNVKWFDTA